MGVAVGPAPVSVPAARGVQPETRLPLRPVSIVVRQVAACVPEVGTCVREVAASVREVAASVREGSPRLELLGLLAQAEAVAARLALLRLPRLVDRPLAVLAAHLLAVGVARHGRLAALVGARLVHGDDALVAANAVVARQLAPQRPRAVHLRLEVAALAVKDVLARRVAGASVRLGAVLVLDGDGAVAQHAAAGGGLAPAVAVAGARLGELAADARELRLLRAVAHDRVGAADVAHLAGGRALGVVVRVERAPAAAAPLDGELAVAAAKLGLAVGRAGARPVVAAAVAHVGLRVVADEGLAVVVAAAGALARLEDVLLVHAH